MKKVLSILLVLIMTLSLFGCGSAATSGNPKEIKIGVVSPISGQSAIAGEYIKNGIELIADQLAKDGGLDVKGTKIPVKFLYEDNEAKPDATANVFRKLIDQDKVIAIVGPDMSKCILAGGPIAQASKIPAIGTFTTNEKVTQIGDFLFRACFIDPFQGKVMAQYAADTIGAKTAAILYNNADDYSKGLMENFKKAFEEKGGKVVEAQAYGGADVKDFNAQLTKIKAANPEVLFMPNQFGEVPLQMKQARQMGITAQFLGGDSWDSPDVPNIAGVDIVEGSAFDAAFSPDDPSPICKDFVKRYKDKYGKNPNSNAVLAYEAAMVVLEGIKNAETLDGQGVRDAMAKIENLEVPSGTITFDANRNPVKGAVVNVYKGGVPSYVTTINPN
ncbi:MAG TPA: ABC transporter substrate-binding protein [Clostridia bacterium]|nr:ABC transporter substrate-binding protein [Clostridia bacterium]